MVMVGLYPLSWLPSAYFLEIFGYGLLNEIHQSLGGRMPGVAQENVFPHSKVKSSRDLVDARKVGGSVLGRLIALDLLLFEPHPLRQLPLGQSRCDASLNEGPG